MAGTRVLLFNLLSSITVLVSCSPYHDFATYLVYISFDCIGMWRGYYTWYATTTYTQLSSWRHTLCDVIFIVWKFQTSKTFEQALL